AEFDAVINIFTAFGYLENEAEDARVLQQVHRALQPGGLFLLETIHRDNLMGRFRPDRITRHADGLIELEESAFDLLAGRSNSRRTLIHPDGRRTEYAISLRLYALSELAPMLAAAGLEVQACFGGLDRSALTLDSNRLVVLSRK